MQLVLWAAMGAVFAATAARVMAGKPIFEWFMVMPMRPEGTEDWSEEDLAKIVTRDTMIGVAVPDPNWTASERPAGAPA